MSDAARRSGAAVRAVLGYEEITAEMFTRASGGRAPGDSKVVMESRHTSASAEKG